LATGVGGGPEGIGRGELLFNAAAMAESAVGVVEERWGVEGL
jgi:hypothetical protein